MKEQNKPYIYAFATIILWSTVASAFKISLRYLDHVQLLLYSSFISLSILFLILVINSKLKTLNELSLKDYLFSALTGILNPFLYYLALFKAYSILPAQEAQILNYTWPMFLVILSVFFLKQKIKMIDAIALIVSFIGVIIISTRGHILEFRLINVKGGVLALSSAVIWALSWILNTRDKKDEIIRLFLNFIFGFIAIAITASYFSTVRLPQGNELLGIIYIGLFEMGITFLIWLKALKLSKNTAKISNLVYLVPFLSLIVIHFTVGEKIFISSLAGLVLIVSGILLQKFNIKNPVE